MYVWVNMCFLLTGSSQKNAFPVRNINQFTNIFVKFRMSILCYYCGYSINLLYYYLGMCLFIVTTWLSIKFSIQLYCYNNNCKYITRYMVYSFVLHFLRTNNTFYVAFELWLIFFFITFLLNVIHYRSLNCASYDIM